MADMILVEPLAFTVEASRGNGAQNLRAPDPREVWADVLVDSFAWFDIDLGANRDWDTIALINTNAAPAGAIWEIRYGAAPNQNATSVLELATTAMRLPSEDVADPTGPAFYRAPAVRNGRYIRVTMAQPVGFAPLSVGALCVGRSWAPTYPREPGTGRPPIDTGTRSRGDDGGLIVVDGALISGLRWTFGDLDPGDLNRLWGMVRRLRTTRPLLLVEDPGPDNRAEGVHWGTFVSLEGYERRDQSKSRWALAMEDWA